MTLPNPLARPRTALELVKGFYQHGAGNCVSIAAIKAAFVAFGTKPIFAAVREEGERYIVTMRDSEREYAFTRAQLDFTRQKAAYGGEDLDLMSHAVFMFTAMSSRALVEGNDGATSFENAVKSLTDGEGWREGPYWLGLQDFVTVGPDRKHPNRAVWDFLAKHKAGIGQSPRHTWFASAGYHDYYGNCISPRSWLERIRSPIRLLNGAAALDVEKIHAV